MQFTRLANLDLYVLKFERFAIRYKSFIKDKQKVRLVEFTDKFIERDWCIKGHIGYIIDGEISINFSGDHKTFRKGDGLFIQGGEKNKHKAKVCKGEKALLILFERV